MAEITVEHLAKVVGISAQMLLQRLKDAGVEVKSSTQTITDEQKQLLLKALQAPRLENSSTAKTIPTLSLKRNVGSAARTGASTQVTVLKRRTHYDAKESLSEEPTVNIPPSLPPGEEVKQPESPAPQTKATVRIKKALKGSSNKCTDEDDGCGEAKAKKNIRKNDATHSLASLNDEEIIPKGGKKKSTIAASWHAEPSRSPSTDVGHVSGVHEVAIPESLTVAELAQKMAIKAAEVIKTMIKMGAMATINQVIDQDTAALVAGEMGYNVKLVKETVVGDIVLTEDLEVGEQVKRAPVVTIMGHVDHGKTSLLDYIRRTKVAAREAGGITQHIGAYRVSTARGVITFLDTPGHEAFTAMRARGAQCTDIVVLIVAADDGIMPQTVEAIQHAKAAKVPLIVAINKIDKLGADPEKIKTALTQYELVPEEWGGDTIVQKISARTGEGVEALLESILIVAEMQDLKAPVACAAKGVVIEAHLDRGHGPVATVLVQSGTLRHGDIILVGLHYGRVRAMLDDSGKKTAEALPGVPVEVLGLSGVPNAGDEFIVATSEKKAREVALFRQGKYRDVKLAKQHAAKLENIFTKMQEEGTKALSVVLKTDVNGSGEAIRDILTKLSTDEVKIDVVYSGVGGITESDVNLAIASHGIILGFNVRADSEARRIAEREGIDIRYYSVIYNLIDDIKLAMSGLLAPKFEEQNLGLIEVREVFKSSKFGTIAGSMVLEGVAKRGATLRLLRNNVVIFEGEIESLRRFKDDVNEVRQGMECGVGIKGYNDVKVGDRIELYKTVEVKRKIQ